MFKNNKLLFNLSNLSVHGHRRHFIFVTCNPQPATCKIALPVEEVLSQQYLSNTKETSMQAQLIKGSKPAFIGEHI
jgi:hypothetical protein